MSKRFFSAGCILTIVGVLAVALAGAGLRASSAAADTPHSWGFDPANLDKTCKPCDDFYQFAMGGWMKSNPIPPEYSSWGSFTRLGDKNQQNLRQILEAAENAKAAPGSQEQNPSSRNWRGLPQSRMKRICKRRPSACTARAWARSFVSIRLRTSGTARKSSAPRFKAASACRSANTT